MQSDNKNKGMTTEMDGPLSAAARWPNGDQSDGPVATQSINGHGWAVPTRHLQAAGLSIESTLLTYLLGSQSTDVVSTREKLNRRVDALDMLTLNH
ncbi:hypothetical protein KIN20_023955 [Parelaphostrongylus tenuis]|uniref:Uncharacterized protein n=1 Tax=Parelaphostrongylus tenuis TaxID=148309 RepID=A0AAD5MXM8_PARTN|nr:hypothetical protein KIN20_023955 [Parelaphostrongylus tenuis]